jgi:hypothetical protein
MPSNKDYGFQRLSTPKLLTPHPFQHAALTLKHSNESLLVVPPGLSEGTAFGIVARSPSRHGTAANQHAVSRESLYHAGATTWRAVEAIVTCCILAAV